MPTVTTTSTPIGTQDHTAGYASIILFLAFFACMSVVAVMEGESNAHVCGLIADQIFLATIAVNITLQKMNLHRSKWHTYSQVATCALMEVRIGLYALLYFLEWGLMMLVLSIVFFLGWPFEVAKRHARWTAANNSGDNLRTVNAGYGVMFPNSVAWAAYAFVVGHLCISPTALIRVILVLLTVTFGIVVTAPAIAQHEAEPVHQAENLQRYQSTKKECLD